MAEIHAPMSVPLEPQVLDAELVSQTLAGRAEAFGTLVERYDRAVYHLCFRTLHDVEEAKDAAQEAFFKAYRGLGTFRPSAKFSTWIFSIAYHACCDRIARRKRYSDGPLPDRADPTLGPEAIAEHNDEARALRACGVACDGGARTARRDRWAPGEIPDGHHAVPPARTPIRGDRKGARRTPRHGQDASLPGKGAVA